jgi:putative transposase
VKGSQGHPIQDHLLALSGDVRRNSYKHCRVRHITVRPIQITYDYFMPWGLKRYQNTGDLHFVTFSCYRRLPLLKKHRAQPLFERALEQARISYGLGVIGYVIMPEHVHLLLSEPDRGSLAMALKSIKQSVARRLVKRGEHFWQERYYDFNVRTAKKRIEKLRYMHRNPVKRGLVEKPEDWRWSSFRNYASGEEGTVEIESPWTARKRERMGITLRDLTNK